MVLSGSSTNSQPGQYTVNSVREAINSGSMPRAQSTISVEDCAVAMINELERPSRTRAALHCRVLTAGGDFGDDPCRSG
jgi:putative NADH-flavin reductase